MFSKERKHQCLVHTMCSSLRVPQPCVRQLSPEKSDYTYHLHFHFEPTSNHDEQCCSVARPCPIIFRFLLPSQYVACSLVSTLWELCSRPYVFGHITAVHHLSFSQCITLFSSEHRIGQYIQSCCFRCSIPANNYVNDNLSLFVQYIFCTCPNLFAVSFWNMPIEGSAFAALLVDNPVRVLTFHNSTGEYSDMAHLLRCCTNIKLLQFFNGQDFPVGNRYHRTHFNRWIKTWGSYDAEIRDQPSPTSLLIQSAQQALHPPFWNAVQTSLNHTQLLNLRVLPHLDDTSLANTLITCSLPYIKSLETSMAGKSLCSKLCC